MFPRDAAARGRLGLLAGASLLLALGPACVTSSVAPPGEAALGAHSPAGMPSPLMRVPGPTVAASPPGSSATLGPTSSIAAEPTPREVPTSFDRSLKRRITHLVGRIRRKSRVPGMAVAVRLPDGETWTATSGLAELDPDRPVTEDTVFAIASVTKTFVAALILQLVEEGRLALDEPVGTWLPDAPRADRVTIRQLLSHRSGIHNYFESPRYVREVFSDPDRRWTYEDIMSLLKAPYCRPDACYHYSNTNYIILGRVAETVTGTPLHRLLRDRFFEPLGMKSAVYQPDEPTPTDAAHGHWAFLSGFTDHTDDQVVIPTMATASVAGAAGAIASNATDLATWAAALYGGDILSRRSRAAMTNVQPPDGYGLGARRELFHGHVAYGHRGGIRGFESSIWYFPREDVAIAVISNRGLWTTDRVVLPLVKLLMGPWPQPAPASSAAPVPSPVPSISPPLPVSGSAAP